jgi:hypothetical protein
MWWAIIPYLINKNNTAQDELGYGGGDFAAYRFLGKEKDQSWGEFLSPKNSLNVVTNLVDPFGDIGLNNLFGKKKDDNKIAGKTQEEWTDELGMSDKELQDYYSELSRTLSTQGAEARNRVDDVSARNQLPASTQLAAERGTQVNQMEATQKGMTALEQMQTEANRRAQQIVLQMFGNKEANTEAFARAEQAATQQQMNQMLSSLGEMLAEKYFANNGIGGQEYYAGNGQFINNGLGTTYEPYTYW